MARPPRSTVKPFRFNASDVLGALALEAERICGAAKLYAHGAAFPDPELIAGTIARMGELNAILIGQKQREQPAAPSNSSTVN
jgi:hypothetical protein